MDAAQTTDKTSSAGTVFSPPVPLDQPIQRGETKIDTLQIRKPGPGELRGLNLVDVAQLDVNALLKLLPRVAEPRINAAEAAALDIADLTALGAEIANFLQPARQRVEGSAPP